MTSRIHDLPVYDRMETRIDSKYFNSARLALKRISNPLRFDLSLRDISMTVEDKEWFLTDRSMNDLPVLAWTEFQTKG